MSETKVDICNLAIAKCGSEAFVTSLSDGTKAARLLSRLYEPTRDALLRRHLWRFARKRAQLSPLDETVVFDTGSYFQLPVDCLRVVGTDQDYFYSYGKWAVEGKKILADTDILNIVYIARIEDESYYDPLFVDAFATDLAYRVSPSIQQSSARLNELKRDLQESVMRAAFAGSTEQDSQKFISEVFLSARY